MRQFSPWFKRTLIISLLFSSPFIFLHYERSWPDFRQKLSGWLINVSAKLQQPIATWFRNRRYEWQRWRAALRSANEWKQMQQQAQLATSLQIALAEQKFENRQLRQLLNMQKSRQNTHAVWAQVIGRKSAPVSTLLRINKGHQSGIQLGDCVMNSEAVVGQVVVVAKTCSDVLLISAPDSVVDIVLQRTRARGMARGVGSMQRYALRVEDFDRLDTVRPGDVAVTSGLVAGFPKGLAVGIVQAVAPVKSGVYLQAQLTPVVDLARLEEVVVLTRHKADR